MEKTKNKKTNLIEEKEGSELIKRTDVKNSPFVIISADGNHFAALGNYRLTELYTSFEECKNDIQKITWNRIIQIITLTNDILNNKNK